jgi:hypothetical protein
LWWSLPLAATWGDFFLDMDIQVRGI